METEEQRKRRLGKSYRYSLTKPKKINPRIYVISDKLRRLPNK